MRKASLLLALLFMLLSAWSWAQQPTGGETPPGPAPSTAATGAPAAVPVQAGSGQQGGQQSAGEGKPATVETPKAGASPAAGATPGTEGTPPGPAPTPAASSKPGPKIVERPVKGQGSGTGNFVRIRLPNGNVVRWEQGSGSMPEGKILTGDPLSQGSGKGQQGLGGDPIVRHTTVHKTVNVTQRIWVRVAPTMGEVRALRDLLLRKELGEKTLDPVVNERDRELAIYYEALANLRYGHLSLPGKTEVVKPDNEGIFSWPQGGLTFHLDDTRFGEPDWKHVEARVAEVRAVEIRKNRAANAATDKKADKALLKATDGIDKAEKADNKAEAAGQAASKAQTRADEAHDRLDKEVSSLAVGALLIGLNLLIVLGFAAALAHQHPPQAEGETLEI